ncbi:PREDICTED: uncharacterized protein LOC109181891 [Ipomoea nil]|uniref:uncharacterized protein LOC109181891 n=1 Tax=Ipomoea nil TaxID=35883 RepID=UPI000901026A|nr:PREDICTED: uncharacterized protein LOC109181891 [Ipomoea nil]XP_019187395.1 PREDICTED: uncharacterized protein LOC109181891 [Ipomoea nil]
MDDLGIQKIQISGPTLASLLNRLSASPGDLHGLLYGHVSFSTTSSLSDDTSASTSAAADGANGPILTAIITSFTSVPSHLALPHQSHRQDSSSTLVGWFSGRRRTPLRPSLHDSTATLSLNSSTSLSFTPQNSPHSVSLPPSLFLLLTTPFQEQVIHTHEYKAFQYRISTSSFEPKSLDIINIGPYFRSHYDSFSPNSPFPSLTCDLRSSNAMVEDENTENSAGIQRGLEDQKELDMCAQGFGVARFSKLMGSNAANYTAEVEELYDKMLAKLDSLARLVEKSSAKVLEQESHNMKLRCKVAGLE